jgi:DNA-binding transcriptional LysR family regulator
MRYDLTSLEIFVAVAEEANLTKASQRQHLAVSAISKRVAELEDTAGVPLLVRQPRGVSLTPAGLSLLHHARQMLKVVDRMRSELSEYAEGVKGHIRIAASTSALTQFLPLELEAFLTRYPMIRVEIEERVGAAIVRAVADGSADLGILGNQTPLRGLFALPYHSDHLALGVPVGHPLARRKAIHFHEALAFPIVGPHVESSLWVLMTEVAQAAGQTIVPRIQVSSFDCMCRLVGAKLGVALLPEEILRPHADVGRLHVVRLKDTWAQRQLVVVVRDLELLPYTTRTFIDHLCVSARAGQA